MRQPWGFSIQLVTTSNSDLIDPIWFSIFSPGAAILHADRLFVYDLINDAGHGCTPRFSSYSGSQQICSYVF